MRKAIALFIQLFIVVILLNGCREAEDSHIINDENPNITIILSKHNSMNLGMKYNIHYMVTWEMQGYTNFLNTFRREFKSLTGLDVKYQYPTSNNQEEYIKNRNVEFYLSDGPDLILIAGGEDYQNLIEEGVALKIQDRIPNYKNVHDAVRDGYFVPITMSVDAFPLYKGALDNLGLSIPKFNWTDEDFHNIMNTFYQNENTFITPDEVNIMINSMLSDNSIFISNGEINAANDRMVKEVEDIRYQLIESGRFKQRSNYNYENYYKMLYQHTDSPYHLLFEERKDHIDARLLTVGRNPLVYMDRTSNILNSLETNSNKYDYYNYESRYGYVVSDEDAIILPRPYPTYSSWGFIVNKNSRNLDATLEFLNFLISEEVQLKLYTDFLETQIAVRPVAFNSPVVNVEEQLSQIHITEGVDEDIINLRKETLRQIIEGERTRNYRGSSLRGAYIINTKEPLSEVQERIFKEGLEEIIVKVVFGDKKYNSEEIMKELRELDNRMRIVLSE